MRRRPMAEVTTRIIQDADLSPSEKLVYLYIAAEYRSHYRNPINYVSCSRIATEINLCESTVRKSLRRLEEVELIRIENGPPNLTVELLHLDNGYSILRQLASAGGQ